MFDHSVIRKSGQSWKAILGFLGTVIGAAPMLPISHGAFDSLGAKASILIRLGGFVLLLVSWAFLAVAIRCPQCGTKWVGQAIAKISAADSETWLLSLKTCPKCGYPDAVDEGPAHELSAAATDSRTGSH